MRFPVHFIDRFFLMTQDRLPALTCMWVLELEGPPLDAERFERAVAEAMRLHPKSSARLLPGGGFWSGPEWESVPDMAQRACVVHPDDFGAGESLHSALVEIMNGPLALERGPLVELHWLSRKSERPVLCYRFHHAVADGHGSLGFLRDVFALYAAAGPPPVAPPLTPPPLVSSSLGARLKLFVELVRLHLRHSFRSRFAGAEKLFAPEARSAQRFGFSARLLPPARVERYRQAAARIGASVNDLLVAAWALAIERWKSEDGKRCGLIRFTINQKLRDPLFGLETLSSSFPVWVREIDRRAPEGLVRGIRKQIREALRRRIAHATALVSALLKLPFPLARWLLRPAILRPRLSDSLILSNLDGALKLLQNGPFRLVSSHALVVPPEGVGALATVSGAGDGTTLNLNYLAGLLEGAQAERLLGLVDQALESLFRSLTGSPSASDSSDSG